MQTAPLKLGLRENFGQFSLLVLVNAFVGAMVGQERSILPIIAEHDFSLTAHSAILSFIAVFGISKACTNLIAGFSADLLGRKVVLVAGWIIVLPVPFLLMFAPSWGWILGANVLLGISQGLTWSTTVIMKIDLVGVKQRGLGMGLNEFAGYFAVSGSAFISGYVASIYGLRPAPFILGAGYAVIGLLLSIFTIRETRQYAAYESTLAQYQKTAQKTSLKDIFSRTSIGDRNLSSISQAGLVNNLNDGMAWGLFPLIYASAGIGLPKIGVLVAIYPALWGVFQLITGYLSDHLGRKFFIVWGMWIQAIALAITVSSADFLGFAFGASLLGIGTAMVYPVLLAAIGDVAHPALRSSTVGVYRFWRDIGYAVGAVLAGVMADIIGLYWAVWIVAGITCLSGLIALVRMGETLASSDTGKNKPIH
ncbi:MFS transporter [Methylophilus sp. 14]|nr:MFS transporter [Methylophilus sp. 14]